MAYVRPGVSATKLIETSLHQDVLDDMYRNPETVEAVIIGSDGSVSVIIEGMREPAEIGKMSPEYKRCFGVSEILSWKVTGGFTLDNLTQVDINGDELTPRAYYGLNIQFKEP